ncbi:MAG: CoA transferase [Gammaproteobacteria bacterium]|nr:CoA transferase [Gammaproteobacteria bacterium]
MDQGKFLSGIRVLDLSQYIPGPFATRQLADLGADVIKVEPPGGDPMRRFMYRGSQPTSPFYRHLNRGKRVCRLDLKHQTGAETLRKLLQESDVLLESFRPGVLERLGFGRQALEAINNTLIHCALSGFGQTGPYRNRAGHDLTYCAVSGSLSLSGSTAAPMMTFPPLADHAGALQAVNSILAALVGRNRSNKGVFIDVSLLESALSWQYLGLWEHQPERGRLMLNGGAACYNIYETADGKFVALAPLETKFWQAFCHGVKHPEWLDRQNDPLPQTELIEELQTMFGTQSLEFWQKRLASIDCCFEAIPPMDKVAEHPQVKARGLIDTNGLSYPAWINDGPVSCAAKPEEMGDAPCWHNSDNS